MDYNHRSPFVLSEKVKQASERRQREKLVTNPLSGQERHPQHKDTYQQQQRHHSDRQDTRTPGQTHRNRESDYSDQRRREGFSGVEKSSWERFSRDLSGGFTKNFSSSSSGDAASNSNQHRLGRRDAPTVSSPSPSYLSSPPISSSTYKPTRTPTRINASRFDLETPNEQDNTSSSPSSLRNIQSKGSHQGNRQRHQEEEHIRSPPPNLKSPLSKFKRLASTRTAKTAIITPKKQPLARMTRQISIESVETLPSMPDNEEEYEQLSYQEKMRLGDPMRIKKAYQQSSQEPLRSSPSPSPAKLHHKRTRDIENSANWRRQRIRREASDDENENVDKVDLKGGKEAQDRGRRRMTDESGDDNPFTVRGYKATISSSQSRKLSEVDSKPGQFFVALPKIESSGGNPNSSSSSSSSSSRGNSKKAAMTTLELDRAGHRTPDINIRLLSVDSDSSLEDFIISDIMENSIKKNNDIKNNVDSDNSLEDFHIPAILGTNADKVLRHKISQPSKKVSSIEGNHNTKDFSDMRAADKKVADKTYRSSRDNEREKSPELAARKGRQSSPMCRFKRQPSGSVDSSPSPSTSRQGSPPLHTTYSEVRFDVGGGRSNSHTPQRPKARLDRKTTPNNSNSISSSDSYLESLSPPSLPSNSASTRLLSITKSPKKLHSFMDLRSPDLYRTGDGQLSPSRRNNKTKDMLGSPSFLSDEEIPLTSTNTKKNDQELCPYCGDPLPETRTERLERALAKVMKREEEREKAALALKEKQQQHHSASAPVPADLMISSSQQQGPAERKIYPEAQAEDQKKTTVQGVISVGNSFSSDDDEGNGRDGRISTTSSPVKRQPRPRPIRRARLEPITIESSSEDDNHDGHKGVSGEQSDNDNTKQYILDEAPYEGTSEPSSQEQQDDLSLLDKFEFCRIHIAEARIVPLGEARGYPWHIRWYALPQRVQQMRHELQGIIDRKVRSTFLDEALERYRSMGSHNARRPGTILGTLDHILPGYYGSRGSHELFKILSEMFLDTKILTKDRASPQKPVEYIQQVLIPETAIRLIVEDRLQRSPVSVTLEEAREIMYESVEFGNYVHEHDPVL